MNKYLKHTVFLGMAALAFSCVPDSVDGDGNGLTPTNSDAYLP